MTCIIIEDQAPAQRILKRYITDVGSLELKECFIDALSALEFLKINSIDLIFLDIHLPKISGIDFLNSLKHQPKIIITTAFSEYAVHSYEFDVEDYLLKPFSFQRFVKAVSKIDINNFQKPEITNQPKEKVFFVKSGYDYLKINSEEIIFIKSDMDYTEIHLEEKKHLTSETLGYWENKLPDYFMRVHKSYLVNTRKVVKVSANQIYIGFQNKIPLGRAFKDGFLSKYVK